MWVRNLLKVDCMVVQIEISIYIMCSQTNISKILDRSPHIRGKSHTRICIGKTIRNFFLSSRYTSMQSFLSVYLPWTSRLGWADLIILLKKPFSIFLKAMFPVIQNLVIKSLTNLGSSTKLQTSTEDTLFGKMDLRLISGGSSLFWENGFTIDIWWKFSA